MSTVESEAKLRKRCIAYAKEMGGEHLRLYLAPGSPRGWPDDIFMFEGGVALFVEFKRYGNSATALQLDRIDTLRKLGFSAGVINNFSAFRNTVDSLL